MLYFIVNTASRTGYGVESWYKIRDELKRNEISYKAYETKYAGHAKALAEKISKLPDEDISLVVVGGDGTVNEVLNGISDFEKVRFAVIPVGSGNDFANGLGLKKDIIGNLSEILKVHKKGKDSCKKIDLGKVSWEADGEERFRLFGISSGIGLDALVCKTVDSSFLKKILNFFHLGKLSYSIMTVYHLFSMDTAEVEMEASEQGKISFRKQLHKMIFMAAMNLYAEGGGVPMAPKASFTDGKLSFCSAAGVPRWQTFLYLPKLLKAKHENLAGFSLDDSMKVKLKLSKPMVLHADGEYLGEVDAVVFEALKGQLRFMCEN